MRRRQMSDGKRNIVAGLMKEYDIKSAEDIQDALKDLLGDTVQDMLESEFEPKIVPKHTKDIVVDFCKDRSIEYHIKDGTITKKSNK